MTAERPDVHYYREKRRRIPRSLKRSKGACGSMKSKGIADVLSW